jgi:hypothetical protein
MEQCLALHLLLLLVVLLLLLSHIIARSLLSQSSLQHYTNSFYCLNLYTLWNSTLHPLIRDTASPPPYPPPSVPVVQGAAPLLSLEQYSIAQHVLRLRAPRQLEDH